MGKTDLDETYIFNISIKMQFFWCYYRCQNSIFYSFGYYWAGSLLTTVRYHELFDWWWFIVVLRKRKIVWLFSAIVWFNVVLCFSLKNCFCGKRLFQLLNQNVCIAWWTSVFTTFCIIMLFHPITFDFYPQVWLVTKLLDQK